MKTCKGLQKPEEMLQISDSTALTFTSTHACRGVGPEASESKIQILIQKQLQ
jgi:hypothetical protein